MFNKTKVISYCFYLIKLQLHPAEYYHSTDRGTPLVCDSHLSGLLSQIIPPQTSDPNNQCENTLKTAAFYTNVTNYVGWILHIFANPDTPSYSGIVYFTIFGKTDNFYQFYGYSQRYI